MWPAKEILEQIKLQRLQAHAGGHIHFSMIALLNNREGIATSLAGKATKSLALCLLALARSRASRASLNFSNLINAVLYAGSLRSDHFLGEPTQRAGSYMNAADKHADWQMSHGDVNLKPGDTQTESGLCIATT
jgi:hypothetical protein